jgi:hypothetical protein
VRLALIAVIILDLALLAVVPPLRTTTQRYALAGKLHRLRALARENRALLDKVAEARRPDRVAERAIEMGLDLHAVEHENIDQTVVHATRP